MQISPDDMYYDRTWFDELGAWLLQVCRRYLPRGREHQLWTTGFTLFAGLCVAWAAGLATHCMLFDVAPHECLAQMLAALLLLVAARHFLAVTGMCAASALPQRKLIRRTGAGKPITDPMPVQGKATVSSRSPAPQPIPPQRPSIAGDSRLFFQAIKQAGINVQIARTLYTAGFRSGDQVRDCNDARLLAIPGIGQATLRKLRVQFGLPKHPTKSQSNAA